jgi:hypothetical protein
MAFPNILQQADPIARALQRRSGGGQTTPVMNQMSGSAPGQQPPQNPNIPPGAGSPYPDTLASMARRTGQSVGGSASPGMGPATPPKSEAEIIVRALMDRLKALTRIEGGGVA